MYKLQDHLPLVLTLVLVLSPTILPARGVTPYTPGVIGGQWALYRQLYQNCTPPNPTLCGSTSSGIDYGLLEVVSVYNTEVTLNLVSVYTNGTGTHQGALVEVSTGYSNFTFSPPIQSQLPPNYFVLAKDLQAGDGLWNSANAPTLNKTVSMNVAGQTRMVNVLNLTQTQTNQYVSTRSSTVFEFDQQTGIFVNLSVSFSANSQYGGSNSFETAFGMVDNNIWSSPPSTSYPDFGISIAPTTISTVQSSHANSTITITRMREFNATVKLTLASSSNSLTCTLSQSKLVKGGTDTSLLSCTGSPGSYTVTVTGDSGYSTHTAQEKIDVGTASSSSSTSQTITPNFLSYLVNPTVDIGIAAAGIIIALLALLLTRRKPVPEA